MVDDFSCYDEDNERLSYLAHEKQCEQENAYLSKANNRNRTREKAKLMLHRQRVRKNLKQDPDFYDIPF